MLMANSPPALATGERCWEKGWHFIWMGHRKPLLITPEGRFIKHEVRDCLPWIKEASTHNVEALTTDPEWPVGLTTTDRDGDVRPDTEEPEASANKKKRSCDWCGNNTCDYERCAGCNHAACRVCLSQGTVSYTHLTLPTILLV